MYIIYRLLGHQRYLFAILLYVQLRDWFVVKLMTNHQKCHAYTPSYLTPHTYIFPLTGS